jgi:hypothetical protein
MRLPAQASSSASATPSAAQDGTLRAGRRLHTARGVTSAGDRSLVRPQSLRVPDGGPSVQVRVSLSAGRRNPNCNPYRGWPTFCSVDSSAGIRTRSGPFVTSAASLPVIHMSPKSRRIVHSGGSRAGRFTAPETVLANGRIVALTSADIASVSAPAKIVPSMFQVMANCVSLLACAASLLNPRRSLTPRKLCLDF